MSADRNLLFGIIALQVNFVTRDQLVEGMNKWVLDKTKSLGELFVAAKAMDYEQFKLLDALVDTHVEKHGGDVQKSIQQLSSIDPHATQMLKDIEDSDLQATVGFISASTVAPHATQPFQQAPTRSASRFRIIRPHARGGLGEVFLAQDTELSREVALKEIQDRYADDTDSRERFLREAEITGRLEHPGIVPVYGLGTYNDGRPFYAMKFVKGESLKDAIDKFHADPETKAAKSLMRGPVSIRFRELLGRFVDVCNAVHYAHSRGILHRDLKPGNVMIGEYGETLVVDWGLAKVLGEQLVEGSDKSHVKPSTGSGSAPTILGTAIGTPAYMSPEQASGLIGELGPATDVYSIGVMLYNLLAGQSPFTGSTSEEILSKVKMGVEKIPCSPTLAVPSSIQSICLMAMKKNPRERYNTVAALAADIKLFLIDEPIAKFPDPITEATSRFIRKYKGIAVFIFFAIGAMGIVIFLSLMVIQRQNIALDKEMGKSASLRLRISANEIKGPQDIQTLFMAARDAGRIGEFMTVKETGDWPESWPKELEELREQSKTIVERPGHQHYAIRFKSREEFEKLWPYLLSIKTKGAPVIVVKGPNVLLGNELKAGIVVHSPAPEEAEDAPPVNSTNFRPRLRHTVYIELVVDGNIIDLNRIQLSTDDIVVDHRFAKSK